MRDFCLDKATHLSLSRKNLLEQVFSRENMVTAWKRVKANKGSAGVDGLSIDQTAEVLKTQWPGIRKELQSGHYRPQAIRRVGIPNPGVEYVTWGYQYGFRPGRSAQDAVQKAKQYVQDGYQIVVDVDLEQFFDRVNHDTLMDRLAKRIADKRILR